MSGQRSGIAHRESRWVAAVAILGVVGVQLLLPSDLTLQPQLLLPAIELALLVAILASNPNRLTAESRDMRRVSIALIGVIGVANLVSLGHLVDALLNVGPTSGRGLLFAALGIWLTNIVMFALVYWELDRGGPHARSVGAQLDPDLLFPQMTLDQPGFTTWVPTFDDYMYVSFTNSTAFSPTDTMPLTGRIKMAMLVQSLLSLVTLGLVVARAVNILG
jgi:uncharacterized membrane protein